MRNCFEPLSETSARRKRAIPDRLGVQEGVGARRYDQNSANQAIAAFTDFCSATRKSDKVALAEQYMIRLKASSPGDCSTLVSSTRRSRHYKSALIYYNDVIEKNPIQLGHAGER